MFIPTPLAFVSWICTVRGWVFLQSLIMCGLYFAAAWVLRRVVWKFVAGAFENFISYNVLKGTLNEWIPLIKKGFYISLGYSIVGFCGAVGAIFVFEPFLWVYFIYLLVSWILNAWQMILRIKAILKLGDSLKKACDVVSAFMSLGSCDDLFAKVKKWLIGSASVILFLQATTLICCGILLRRAHKARRKARHSNEGDSQPEMQERNALGKRDWGSQGRGWAEISSDEDSDIFDLPRRQAVQEEEIHSLPEGRQRRGNAGRAESLNWDEKDPRGRRREEGDSVNSEPCRVRGRTD